MTPVLFKLQERFKKHYLFFQTGWPLPSSPRRCVAGVSLVLGLAAAAPRPSPTHAGKVQGDPSLQGGARRPAGPAALVNISEAIFSSLWYGPGGTRSGLVEEIDFKGALSAYLDQSWGF